MSDADWIDEQKIATPLVNKTIDRLLSGAEGKIKKKWAQHRNKTREDFVNYLAHRYRLCKIVKNYFFDQDSADLEEIYLDSLLSHRDKMYFEEDFLRSMRRRKNTKIRRPAPARIIRGPAGIGKSFFMRASFIRLSTSDIGLIPIFFELRSLNRRKLTNFPTAITDEVNSFGSSVSVEQIKDGLENGIFFLIFDGFDELKKQVEDHYESELLDLSRKYPLCPIMVASRPADRISAWNDFDIFNLVYLDQPRVIKLIRKLEYDEMIKEKFIQLIEGGLYDTHTYFFEIPLLATIMLLTYGDVGRISNHTHEFFEDAFNAVWNKHDARKEGYERQRYTGLNKSQFIQLLSAFSISSYTSQHFDFRDDQFSIHFEIAQKLSGCNVSESDFLKDLIISTSLFIRDGTLYRYTHRLFQEYFAARYIVGTENTKILKIIDKVAERYTTDHVLPMILSISEENIEKMWIMPKLEVLIKRINKIKCDDGYQKYFYFSTRNDLCEILRRLYSFKPQLDDMLVCKEVNTDFLMEYSKEHPDDFGEDVPPEAPDFGSIMRQDKMNLQDLLDNLREKYETQEECMEELLLGD